MRQTPLGKVALSCNQCKARKVRCDKQEATDTKCINCTRRQDQCRYDFVKTTRRRRNYANQKDSNPLGPQSIRSSQSTLPADAIFSTSQGIDNNYPSTIYSRSLTNTPQSDGVQSRTYLGATGLPEAHIDYILADRDNRGRVRVKELPAMFHGFFGTSSSLAYFSERRVQLLATCLGNDKVTKLVENIANVIDARLKGMDKVTPRAQTSADRRASLTIPKATPEAYIRAYFEQIHPIYPFLDEKEFRARVLHSQDQQSFPIDKAWSALYHAVLALGCQFHDGGSFEPGKGEAWKYFEISLSLLPDLLIHKGSLLAVQAVTGMAVFSLNISCIQIEAMMVSEGAKMAQTIGLNKASNPHGEVGSRTFWVLYWLEKSTCFFSGKGSVLMDCDIGCSVPYVPEATCEGFDWFLTYCRYGRLVSRAYECLFTVTVAVNPFHWDKIDLLKEELEKWRTSIPEPFRPGSTLKMRDMPSSTIKIALRLQLFYYNALIAFSRVTAHIGADEPSNLERQNESKMSMMRCARSVLELTKFIDVETYTPSWIIAIMPISALFILFDLVIHNPNHAETRNNLALLDVGSGHFSRMEYASSGTLPGSLISEFAHLARAHVQRTREPQPMTGFPFETTNPVFSQNEEQNNLETRANMQGITSFPDDALLFPMLDDPNYLLGNMPPVGTDVMNLFGSMMPEFPSFFSSDVE